MRSAGFTGVRVEEKDESAAFIKDWMPGSGAEKYVVSAYVTGTKPLPAPVAAYALVAGVFPELTGLLEAGVGAVLRWLFGARLPRMPKALRRPAAPAPEPAAPAAGTSAEAAADAGDCCGPRG
mmetsp:Transcript_23313/g.78363  ORF Transcript_23313/g.78363 Transcript_23313/m.78363 type:complete len:123 (-) Transcript_23313:407-775(-)